MEEGGQQSCQAPPKEEPGGVAQEAQQVAFGQGSIGVPFLWNPQQTAAYEAAAAAIRAVQADAALANITAQAGEWDSFEWAMRRHAMLPHAHTRRMLGVAHAAMQSTCFPPPHVLFAHVMQGARTEDIRMTSMMMGGMMIPTSAPTRRSQKG
jgi:hypothetical protein